MSNIEHLFENILTRLELGEDLLEFQRHPTTQRMLNDVTATFDEILQIALYVHANYCDGCRWMGGDTVT